MVTYISDIGNYLISQESLRKSKLQGRVDTIKEAYYSVSIKFGDLIRTPTSKNGYYKLLYKYDSLNGALCLRKSFEGGPLSNISVRKIHRYKWGEFFTNDGYIISDETIEGEKQKVLEVHSYTLENENDDENDEYETTLPYYIVEKYNSYEKIIELTKLNRDLNVDAKHIFKYDAKGFKTEESSFNQKGDLENRNLLFYNDNGNIIKEIIRNGKRLDYLNGIYQYEYDSKDRVVLESHSNKVGVIQKTEFSYQESAIHSTVFESNRKVREIKTIYDSYGNILEREINRNEYINYVYEYDKEGNWIEKIEYKENIPQLVTQREITYFKD